MAAGPSAEAALVSILTVRQPEPCCRARRQSGLCPTSAAESDFSSIRSTRASVHRGRSTARLMAAPATPHRDSNSIAGRPDFAMIIELSQAVYGLLEGYTGIAAGLQVDYISTDDEAAEIEVDAGPDGKDLYRKDSMCFWPTRNVTRDLNVEIVSDATVVVEDANSWLNAELWI